ncbi:MAG TPA: acyltransferase [Candidatus Dormibacteraeota bacterium]|nr:acyltransferase [Candidatus Dormibacteraeota bacterium]
MGLPERVRRLPWQLRHRHAARLASSLRRAGVLATHRHAHVVFRGPVRLGPGFSVDIEGPGTFDVGPGVDFRRRFHCEIAGDGVVRIGAGSAFTHDVLIQCSTSIEIGERCMFAQGVLVVDGNHRFRDLDAPPAAQGYDYRPIRIGDDVWVGAKATVIADVGRRAVVAAGAVVTRPVPPMCVAAGVPARIVEYFGPPGERPAEAPSPA